MDYSLQGKSHFLKDLSHRATYLSILDPLPCDVRMIYCLIFWILLALVVATATSTTQHFVAKHETAKDSYRYCSKAIATGTIFIEFVVQFLDTLDTVSQHHLALNEKCMLYTQ